VVRGRDFLASYLPGFLSACWGYILNVPAFRLQAVKVTDGFGGDAGTGGRLAVAGFFFFGANHGEFAGIEPVTAAIGALVDLDLAFGAREMAMQLDVATAGTGAFSGRVDGNAGVPFDLQQVFAGRFLFFIDALEFERVKPNASTASLTNVHANIADLFLDQFVVARGTFHGRTYHSAGRRCCQVPGVRGLAGWTEGRREEEVRGSGQNFSKKDWRATFPRRFISGEVGGA
jgi:hypothetical protein